MTTGAASFDLVEVMRFDPMEGLLHLEAHLERLCTSAQALGFVMDRHAVRNELHAATFRRVEASQVRLHLARSGAVAIEATDAPTPPVEPVTVALVPLPLDPNDLRLRHRTSDRAFYDAPRETAGTFEVAFVGPDGGLTEGSFTNLFVLRADGVLVTPPLSAGLLPGILRARLIEAGEASEGHLTLADLADGFFVGNALHGLIAARLV